MAEVPKCVALPGLPAARETTQNTRLQLTIKHLIKNQLKTYFCNCEKRKKKQKRTEQIKAATYTYTSSNTFIYIYIYVF